MLVNKYGVINSLLKSAFSLYINKEYSFEWKWFCENDIVLPWVKHNKSLKGLMNILVNKYWVITSQLKTEFSLVTLKRNIDLNEFEFVGMI